jgi:hypothetical protein
MSTPNYNRADQDEAHYVHLAGEQYIGFVSKQLACELLDELAVASQNPPSPSPVDARVACADATNNACVADASKLDDHGGGGFIVEGGYCQDRSGRMRGPIEIDVHGFYSVSVDDKHGFNSFSIDGYYHDEANPSQLDLLTPWIDWKAECEKLKNELAEERQFHSDTIEKRDNAEYWADKLASGIAEITGHNIGEHSNLNNPWQAAFDSLASLKGAGA